MKTPPTPNPRCSGWLCIDKPLGISSAVAVARVKRLVKPNKVGHAGTLDPLASGILPIAIGGATRTAEYLMGADKTYRFTVRWGEQRTTDDLEGEVVATSDVRPTQQQIETILPQFIGEIDQAPPIFSALKVEGDRAYDLARAGKIAEMPKRKVRVHGLSIVGMPDAAHTEFEVNCGKGTYVRSLARDLGLALGGCGCVSALRRTRVGKFDEAGAISLAKIQEMSYMDALIPYLLPAGIALDDIPAVTLPTELVRQLCNGVVVQLPEGEYPSGPFRVCDEHSVRAIGERKGSWLRPVKVLV